MIRAKYAAQIKITREFFLFCVIGTAAFVVDASVLMLLISKFDFDKVSGRFVSITLTTVLAWWGNRRLTFKSSGPAGSEYLRYLLSAAIAATVNVALFVILSTRTEFFSRHVVLAVAVGCLAGLLINFLLSRFAVFRRS